MVYAVDFDGTLCEDAFPEIGAPRLAVIGFVKAARAAGDSETFIRGYDAFGCNT